MLDNHHDIKGLAIKKSNINRQVGNALQTLLHDDILKSKEIDVRQILVKLNDLEESIRDTFRRGETKYLTPTSCKVASSYKNPATIAPFRAAVAWNAAYPNNPIVLPENFNQFKCTITSLEDIAPLYDTHPDIYKRLKEEIFDNETFKKYGITYFAIPKNVDKIPEWIIPYVDVDTIINDNLSVFNPVLESLGLKILSNTKGDFYSNIISI